MEYKNILNMINKKNINYYIINDSARELYDYIFLRKKYNSKKISIITDNFNLPIYLSDIFELKQIGNSTQPYILSYKTYDINVFICSNGYINNKYLTYKNKFNIEKFKILLNKNFINKKQYNKYKFYYNFNKQKLKKIINTK